MRRRVGASGVDLRERAEAALPADADFVSALDLLLDLAFDRQAGAECVFELTIGRGAARQLPGQLQPARGRDHHRLDAVADGDFDIAVIVFQLGDLDRRFAFAADVDEGHLRADGDDSAFDGLPLPRRFALTDASNIAAKSSVGRSRDAPCVLPLSRLRGRRVRTASVRRA